VAEMGLNLKFILSINRIKLMLLITIGQSDGSTPENASVKID
jgi:hypothetical protein